ncbi:MAG: DNA topoisomerase 4 subunit A [Aeriscardovia sp.]|nr:DNA topoisomerase 4 subunit A [Aeriscardovia sp.]
MSKRKASDLIIDYDPRQVEQNIIDTPLESEMTKSFLAYAYSVIYSRALPDARDGLKPVQRRIIYQMGQMHLTPDKPYMKSARAVGEVMGKLHPHGDSSIYEAMVHLAQPFSQRLPLIDGHGNFGSLDDGPAASRYTEARLSSAALGMNEYIDEETVPFIANYDNKLREPTVLPSAVPNLLVNGSTGIAVGMATNMPTHNVREVIKAAKYLLKNPDATVDDLMKYIPGPDLPGGGIIIGTDGIRQAYETGKGSFTTRAKVTIDTTSTGKRSTITVTELPYMVGPEKVLSSIGTAIKDKKITGISNAVDLSDRKNGLRLLITLKQGYDPDNILTELYKLTPMESTFTINNVALVDGRPHTLSLKQLLRIWINHRRTIITNKSLYEKHQYEDRVHLLEGLLHTFDNLDHLIHLIRHADNQTQAKKTIMKEYNLDETQTKYLLDLPLRKLTKLSYQEITTEYNHLTTEINTLTHLLSTQENIDTAVTKEMDKATKKWGDNRRTTIITTQGKTITQSPQQNTTTHTTTIISDGTHLLQLPTKTYQKIKPTLTTHHYTLHLTLPTTHTLGLLTTDAHLLTATTTNIPEYTENTLTNPPFTNEKPITTLLDLTQPHTTTLLLITTQGLIKRTHLTTLLQHKYGTPLLPLTPHDHLCTGILCPENSTDNLLLTTSDNHTQLTTLTTYQTQNTTTNKGIIGIKLKDNQHVTNAHLLTTTQHNNHNTALAVQVDSDHWIIRRLDSLNLHSTRATYGACVKANTVCQCSYIIQLDSTVVTDEQDNPIVWEDLTEDQHHTILIDHPLRIQI